MAGEGGRGRASTRCLAVLGLVGSMLAGGPAVADTGPTWLYTARPGDTIWNLSRRYLRNWHRWPELQAVNGVAEPRRIPPGSILRFPVAWLRTEPATARVVAFAPPAQVRHARGDVWEMLAIDQPLEEGAAVAAGPAGSVTLELVDATRVLLPGETRIVLERLRRYAGTPLGDTHLRLVEGRLVPNDVAEGSQLSILSPPGTTSVRGTSFRVAMEQNATRLQTETLRGSVAVAGSGRRVSVAAGFGTTTTSGQAPRSPVPLLPPPDARRVPERVERVPFVLDLAPLAGAVQYRLVVGHDDAFSTLAADVVGASPLLRVPVLPDGSYA